MNPSQSAQQANLGPGFGGGSGLPQLRTATSTIKPTIRHHRSVRTSAARSPSAANTGRELADRAAPFPARSVPRLLLRGMRVGRIHRRSVGTEH
jgi:hypothetical protein